MRCEGCGARWTAVASRALRALVFALPLLAAPAAAQQPEFRVPVLLVPGWFAGSGQLDLLRRRFHAAGWPDSAVLALDFESRVGDNRAHAREIARGVERLRARTGATKVDVVAHSMGGLATRRYLRALDGADRVRRVVFLGTPHHGTLAAHLAWGAGGRQMIPGSAFLEALGQGEPVPSGVEATTIRTPFDLRVFPPSSGTLDGVPEVVVCCPSHPALLYDPKAFAEVLKVLGR